MSYYYKLKLCIFFQLFLLITSLKLVAQDRNIELTQEEKAWISSHPVLNVGNERFWPPIDFAINGEAVGYSIDLLDLIAKKLGVEINYINGLSWVELLEERNIAGLGIHIVKNLVDEYDYKRNTNRKIITLVKYNINIKLI